MEPKYGRDSLLWMIEEIADVYMYLTDTLLRYRVSEDDLGKAYFEKHKKNIGRNFTEEHRVFLQKNED